MARMSSNDKHKSEKYGDSSQLPNWILDLGATCHMTPEVLDSIPVSLEDTDKYIEVADGHHVTVKQKGQVQIQICDNNIKTFIVTLYNVLLAPNLCNRLFSIITLMATTAKITMTIRYTHLCHACIVMTNAKV